jgi:hypothetical protein
LYDLISKKQITIKFMVSSAHHGLDGKRKELRNSLLGGKAQWLVKSGARGSWKRCGKVKDLVLKVSVSA